MLFVTTGLLAQSGQQKVDSLLIQYQEYGNLSRGQTFSNKNDMEFLNLFLSKDAMVSALGIATAGNKQVPVNGLVNLIKGNFDEESDISITLTKIKNKKPSKISSFKYLYKVFAVQNFNGFKKDGTDFSSIENLLFKIEYNTITDSAFIVSTEVLVDKSGLYLNFHALGGMTSITGEMLSSVSGSIESNSQFSFGLGAGLDYMISENIGITTGVTFMTYKSSFTVSNFEQDSYETVDIDNDNYYLHATSDAFVNDVKLSYIEIPIGIVLRFGGFITRLGIKYGIPGSSTSTFSSGSITTTGYYPEYNVLLYDIPEYGFDTYVLSDVEGKVEPESAISAFIQLGYSIPLSQKANLSFTGVYQTSLGSVYESGAGNITTGNKNYTSVLNLMDSPKVSAFGLEIAFEIKLF